MDDKFIMFGLDDERSKDIAEVLGNKTCKKIIDYLSEKNKNYMNQIIVQNPDPTEIKANSNMNTKNLGQKKEIKLKVYKLLKKVINHISYIYLSFLYIDVE